jgi:hypothetical protein
LLWSRIWSKAALLLAASMAAALLLVMLTWRRGVKIVADAIRKEDIPLDDLIRRLEAKNPTIVRGTAIYLTLDPEHAPAAHPVEEAAVGAGALEHRAADRDRHHLEGARPRRAASHPGGA